MQVPLSARSIVKQNKEMISFWYNGKNKIIKSPILPYLYSNKQDTSIPAKITEVYAIKLSNWQQSKFFRYDFDTREELVKYRDDLSSFEANIPFLIRNAIDNPDLFTKLPNTNDLKFLFLDIEQYTKPDEIFPTYDDRIISIAYCTNDREIRCIYLGEDATTDKKLLLKFIEEYKKINPDVIVLYNKSYDMPTILHRCEKNSINTSFLSKNNVKPYIGGKEEISIEGVIIYDAFYSSQTDQELTGNVANKGLKAVSNYYGFKTDNPEFQMKRIHELVGTKELIAYNRDDIKRLLRLFDIYWNGILYNANNLKIPLNLALNLNITDLGLLILGREYRAMGVISDGQNQDRYPEVFNGPGVNYEGALVGISRTGLFEPVYKVDYSSMYPSIMAKFNLSPDTTTLLGFEQYGKFSIEEDEQWYIYHIPDGILQQNMEIQVLKKPGFCAKLVEKFLNERKEYKKKWKETDDKRYKAMSDNRKVKANGGIYGIQGAPHHAFGFVPIAIATTGIGRECAQMLIDILNSLYPKSVIEFDTDGIYITTDKFDKNKILEMFNMSIEEKFKKKINLNIDFDSYKSGYFYKTKNYILQKHDGTIILHGVALKSSRKDNISKNLINEIARAKLDQKDDTEIIKRYKKLDFKLKDFAMSITMGMPMKKYKNQNNLVPRLARQAQSEFGVVPQQGNQYHYIKGISDYKIVESAKISEIDKDYYVREIDRIVAIFARERIEPKISKWL